MRNRRPRHPSTWAAVGVYLVLLMAAMLEQFGKTTNDTKTPLIEAPARFLEGALSLWNPEMSMGELQNQAYGYLFPQGPFFLLGDVVHMPPWITERLWSVLLLVVGCEGARRLSRYLGFSEWAALIAGLAYGLNPRTISQIGVRTGEILPGVALPWVVLPIVLALTGRLGPRRAAVLSVAAFMFSGALNATATVAILPLVIILIVWGARRGMVGWGLLGWWSAWLTVTSVWWAASLLKLRVFSPPFFDYVEDADVTTKTTGYTSALRGASNWVNYNATGGYPTWPAGFELAYEPWMVAATGLLAVVGLLGLVTWYSPWRTPLALSVGLGLVCLVVGHQATLGSPLSGTVRDMLDGDFDLFRNVAKIDPILRLPVSLGVGLVFARVLGAVARAPAARRRRTRAWMSRVAVGGLTLLVLGMAQPALALNLRTPGWTEVPDYWQQTADYLADQPGDDRAWVIPGSGFGVQTWGWTMDEPMSSVASTAWVTRSQVPLVPPETIRVLSRLEEFLASGAGSDNLGTMLARLGIGHIVVRHDLDPSLAEATSISLVSIAMARSEGVTRAQTFGTVGLGPAIEVFDVDVDAEPSVTVVPQDDAVTVAGASADVIDAVGRGLVRPDQVAIVQGDSGWDRPADVVGDSYRLRIRNFGRVHDAEGAVLAPGEPTHSTRLVPNYPGNPASKPVVARYTGVTYVDASSSSAYTDGLGEVRPEDAPFSAVDDDPETAWRSGFLEEPVGQWLDIHLAEKRDLGTVRVTSTVSSPVVGEVRKWTVQAGGKTRTVDVDPFTGVAEADLSGVRSDRLRLVVAAVQKSRGLAPVSVRDVHIEGLSSDRTMVLPSADLGPHADFVFTAQPEVRTCITTLLAPDCNVGRGRLSDESEAIDRTFEVSADGTFALTGTVVARANPGTARLLDPIGEPLVLRASSTLASDPTVSARMAYDGNGASSWIADAADATPTLTIDFAKPRTLSRIGVQQPAQPAVTPTEAVLRNEKGEVRRVELGDFGAFEPLRAKQLTIELHNPTRGLSPIGMSELYLAPRSVTIPFDGAAETGAVCGFGPTVEVDGTTYLTRVDGFMGNVVSAGPMDMTLCDAGGNGGGHLDLDAGVHRLRVVSTHEFQPVATELDALHPTTTAEPAEARSVEVLSEEPSHQELEIGAGDASILRTTRNYNDGWTAELDGRTLPVQRVDGWAQGWRVPAGAGGRLVISYAPERSYVTVLVVGLGVALAFLLAAGLLLLRTHLSPRRPADAEPLSRRWHPALVVTGLLAAGTLSWLLGGVPALAGLALTVPLAFGRLRRVALWLATALLLGGTVWVSVALQLHRGADQPWADVLTGTGVVLAMGSILVRARPAREPSQT